MNHHRPTYHLCPPANWMNDPNGAIQWKGQYHLFYQYNPNGAFSATKHWAHAASPDLIHWEYLPIALAPEPGSYDKDGCFSGCMVVHNDVPTIVYTGVRPEVQCLATSSDDLLTWQKHPANPVLDESSCPLKVKTFRDPFVWKEADGLWYMAVGSGITERGGACLLYRSADLLTWEYMHPLLVDEEASTGLVWNCPNFFPVDGRHVLIVSGQPVWKPFYWSGSYEDHHFKPQTSGLVDYGGCLYAALVFNDEAGRTLFWGWIWESRPDDEILQAGWAGAMALPRTLFLNEDGTLGARPAPEVQALRKRQIVHTSRVVAEGQTRFENADGASLELRVHFAMGQAQRFGVCVLGAADGSEQTLIGYDVERCEVFVDRRQAGLRPTMAFNWPNPDYHAAPLELAAGEALELHIFVDHSVIEVFANQGRVLSSRVYTRGPESVCVGLFAQGGECQVDLLEVWEL